MERLVAIGISHALAASALALVALAAGRLLRRPAVTHALWLLVLVKLLTPPLVAVPIFPAHEEPLPSVSSAAAEQGDAAPSNDGRTAGELFVERPKLFLPIEDPLPFIEPLPEATEGAEAWPGPPRSEPQSNREDEAVAAESVSRDGVAPEIPAAPPPSMGRPSRHFGHFTWAGLACALWGVGSVVWCCIALARIVRFQRALGWAKPAPDCVQQAARELAERMGLRPSPIVEIVPGTLAPLVWFVGRRPRVLLSAGLLERLDPSQAAGLVAHELAHLRRRDHWVRLVELAATGLYWWNPVLWWARGELREAEEQCCDAWAVWALRGPARAYAETLLTTVEFLSEAPLALPPLASGLAHERVLRRRLTMIMRKKTSRRLSWVGRCALLALAAALLPLVPGRAQSEAAPAADQGGSENTAGSSIEHQQGSRSGDGSEVRTPESNETPGTVPADKDAALSAEALAALQQLRESQEAAQYMERMYKRGFATKSQLEAAQLALARAQRDVQERAHSEYERAKADYAQAQRDVEIAKLNIQQAKEATFPQEENELQVRVAAAEGSLVRARQNLEHVKKLSEKGFSTQQEVAAAEFAVTRAQLELQSAKTAQNTARKFSQPKALKELEAKIEQAEAELAEAKARLEQAETGAASVNESTDFEVAVTVGKPVAIVRSVNREAGLVYLEPIVAENLWGRAQLAVFPAGGPLRRGERPRALLVRVGRKLPSEPSWVAARFVQEKRYDPVQGGDIAVLQGPQGSDVAPTQPENRPAKQGVVANVNGQPITDDELAKACVARHGAEVLGVLINRRIIEQACAQRGISITAAEIDAEIEASAKPAGMTREALLKKYADQRGADAATVIQDIIWPKLALSKLAAAQVDVTEQEIEQAFQARFGERVKVRMIMCRDRSRALEAWEKAKRAIDAGRPEEFTLLVREYSTDAASRPLGGRIRPIARQSKMPALEEAAFNLREGDLSAVIEVGNYYVILLCEGRTDAVDVRIDEVRDRLREDIRRKKAEQAIAGVFAELKDAATIERFMHVETASAPGDDAKQRQEVQLREAGERLMRRVRELEAAEPRDPSVEP